ncbi:hypothetical protein LR48_Vigan07g188300 [Vigna angularis]|uniref:Uncharacterized protein n=1 Tax=Phaseolus angularis TaxID=3914 RepID=A0A0L9V077_PHAAN|nr:hypothetical protein LR48_Vigan07g188300 [Vigna angularis]
MASSSSQRKRVKTLGRKNMFRGPTLDGWISDESAQQNFLDTWKMRKTIAHKYVKLSFFKREGFNFPRWLSRQGLKTFVEMAEPWYLELVRVFYSNLKVNDRTFCSRVKGTNIMFTNEVWAEIVGFRLGSEC